MENQPYQKKWVPPYRSPYQRKFGTPVASDKFKEFQDKKEKSIAKFTDKREISIIRTSSINDAVAWCTKHPDWSKKMTEEQRWDWVRTVAKQFVEFFAIDGQELDELLANGRDRVEEIREKEKAAVEIEVGTLDLDSTPKVNLPDEG